MDKNQQLTTPAIDLLAPADRFTASSRLHGRLHRYRLLVRRYWWVISLILAFVVWPVYLVSRELPPAYRSKARLWLTGKLNINEGRLYTEELIDYLSTQAELVRSSTVQRRALARLRSQFTNDFSGPFASRSERGFRPVHTTKAILKGLLGSSSTSSDGPEDDLPFQLKVTESPKSSILELRATGPDPAATRAFLNCLIEEYFAFRKEGREKASEHTLTSVTGEVHGLAEQLKAQQEKLHAFQTSNNVVFLQEQGSSAASYLGQVNKQIATLRTQLRLLEKLQPDQWMDAESRRSTGTSGEPSEAATREALASLAGPQSDLFKATQQLALLKAKRDDLSRFLRPEHPKIVKLNEDIAAQEKLAEVSRGEALKQLGTRRQTLEAEIKNLESAFSEWDVKALEASRKMADYDRLRQDLQRLQTAYDRLQGVMQTVDVSKTLDQDNVGVLEPASVARPVPRMLIYMAAALFVALVLSFAALYCLGLLDDRFASPAELASYFSEEVLGQIPAISLKLPKGRLGIQYLERQRFEFLESFRNIRSSLLYMRNGQTRPKTLLVTSAVPGEGKSTVALYLAATMALAESRVLLIDGDMRRPSLHKFLAAKPRPGLAETLSQEAAPARAIVPSSLEKLFLLPAGAARRNPGELVLSSAWARLMAELAPQFDYILIDSPPLLATDDAACLGPKVDGVLMVVRGCFTSARIARRGLELLRQRHAHVLGLIFNRAPAAVEGYHYYKRYQEQYRWHGQPAKQISA